MSESQTTSPSGLVALSCILPIICIVAVSLRFWLRERQKLEVKIDDWIMLPSLILFIGMCICAMLGVHRRVWGYPTPTTEQETDLAAYDNDSIYEGQLQEAFQFIQIPALGCIKLGALLFYRRIFCIHGKNTAFSVATLIYIGTITLWTIAMIIMNALQCGSHISALWSTTASVYVKKCVYAFPFETGFAVSNFVLDLMIVLLPIPSIWALHTSLVRKFAVSGVFGLALIGLAASIARMVQYLQVAANGPSLTADFRLEDTASIFWSNLEAGLSLVAVNLPSLWAIISKTSPASILASLRSIITLSSHGSSRASRSHTRILDDRTTQHADGSQIRIYPTRDETTGEWHKMHDIESREIVP